MCVFSRGQAYSSGHLDVYHSQVTWEVTSRAYVPAEAAPVVFRPQDTLDKHLTRTVELDKAENGGGDKDDDDTARASAAESPPPPPVPYKRRPSPRIGG
jgi:hypothetical protein